MTEEEWLAAIQADEMLDFYWKNASIYWKKARSRRKMCLFDVACCRKVETLLIDERSRNALTTAEGYADGLASSEELAFARNEASISGGPMADPGDEAPAVIVCHWDAANAVWHATEERSTFCVSRTVSRAVMSATWAEMGRYDPEIRASGRRELASHADFLRDIFGNPFRPISLNRSWLTSTVLALARGIYEEKVFGRMPILADALQDAGCENAAILDYCRDTKGVHTRGCWVVDLLLDKK